MDGEPVQSLVDSDDLFGVLVERENFFFQLKVGHPGTSLLSALRTRVVDNDLTHDAGGQGKEVSAIVDGLFAAFDQLDISFIHQGRSLNGLLLAS